jgi:hypothetical protein
MLRTPVHARSVLSSHSESGANTAIFRSSHGVLLNTCLEQPGQLVQVGSYPQLGKWTAVTPGAFTDWKGGSTSLEAWSLVSARCESCRLSEGQPNAPRGFWAEVVCELFFRFCAFKRCSVADSCPTEDMPGHDKSKVWVIAPVVWHTHFGA